jgi:Heterokaryon incompatibility protein (HET)
MAQLEYKFPLGEAEIRLPQLAWGDPDATLHGRLLTRTLDVDQVEYDSNSRQPMIVRRSGSSPKAEEYEALSYPWGVDLREESRIKIALGGKNDDHKPFNIKANLEAALRLLRSHIEPPQDSKFVWVDALCINQNDLEEKSTQIPLMAEIYSHASEVSVWLGESTPNSDMALAFISSVINLDDFDELVNPFATGQWEAFCDLLKRRWFGWGWIVQEIALARTAALYCGGNRIL